MFAALALVLCNYYFYKLLMLRSLFSSVMTYVNHFKARCSDVPLQNFPFVHLRKVYIRGQARNITVTAVFPLTILEVITTNATSVNSPTQQGFFLKFSKSFYTLSLSVQFRRKSPFAERPTA